MISPTPHQSWLFYLPLAQQAALLKDDLLEPVDHLLDDSLLVDLVRDCLASRTAQQSDLPPLHTLARRVPWRW